MKNFNFKLILFLVAFQFLSYKEAHSQLVENLSILLGGTSSNYDLTAGSYLVLDSVANNVTASYCSPSNGMTSVRGGACDEPGAEGAYFVTIHGLDSAFPSRIGKTANYPGSSNYFASVNHNTSLQKIWICYSARYYSVVGSVTYDWEYQIRIHKDSLNPANDYAKILTLTNTDAVSKEEYLSTWSVDYDIIGISAIPTTDFRAIENIRIVLGGGSSNYETGGTDMVLDSIGSAGTTCAPSNGETAVRGDACEQVDTGAWYQPIHSLDWDFPQRIGGPTINRKGASNYIAQKYAGTDSAKYWICYSAGADEFIGSSQVYDWEYQIQIHIDSANLSNNYCKIQTVPNSNTPSTIEYLSGWQVYFDVEPYIKGHVQDVYFSFDNGTGTLEHKDLQEVIVALTGEYNGNFVYAYDTTDSYGNFYFDTLSEDYTYILDFFKDSSYSDSVPYTSIIRLEDISSNTNLGDINMPVGLLRDVEQTAENLKEFNYDYALQGAFSLSWFGLDMDYDGYDVTEEETFLKLMEDMSLLVSYDVDDMIESLSRLIILNNCLDSSSQSAELMIQEMLKSTANLCLHAISFKGFQEKISLDVASETPDDLVRNSGKMAVKKMTVKWDKYIEMTIDMYTSTIEDATFASKLNKTLKQAVNAVKLAYNAYTYLKELKEEGIKDAAALIGTPLLMQLHIDEFTQDAIFNSIPQAPYDSYSSSFNSVFSSVASGNSSSLLEKEQQATKDAKSTIQNINYAGTISSVAGEVSTIGGAVLTATGVGVPIAAGLMTVGKYLKMAQLGTDIAEVAVAAYRWYEIDDEVDDMATASFQGKMAMETQNLNVYDKTFLSQNKVQLDSTLSEFYNIADSIIYYMQVDSLSDVVRKTEEMVAVDSLLNETADIGMYLWMNAASYSDTIANFDSLYSASATSYGDFLEAKMSFHFVVLAYLMDTASVGTICADSAQYYLYGFIEADSLYSEFTLSSQSFLSSIAVSSYLVPSVVAIDTIDGGASFTYTVTIKNYGTVIANNAYAKLSLDNYLTSSNDSIYIGSISAYASTTVTFTISADNIDTSSYISVLLYSSNGKASSSNASVYIKSSISTNVFDLKNINTKDTYINCYPNPSTNSFNISYIINQTSTIDISLYDMFGKKVGQLLYKEQSSGDYMFTYDASALPSGMYMIYLNTNAEQRSAKIAVSK